MAKAKVSVRIETNSDGIRQLLQGKEVYADIERRAQAAAASAGEGYEAEAKVLGGSTKLGRAMGYVTAVSMDAKRDNAENNTLIRSLDAAR